jgi:peptide/nickel transport system substrate-binding protein
MLAIGSGLLVPAASGSSSQQSGTFRIASGPRDIDPALALDDIMLPACGTLMGYPSRPPPAGLRLRPELADGPPVVSRNGKTYTFTVRRDARFSDGTPVTARAFARALERIRVPEMRSELVLDFADVREVRTDGRTLIFRLKRRAPAFLERTTALCAVPPSLPADPEGAKAPLPSAAPYFAAEFVPGERLVLERNRFYRGKRLFHVERFVIDLDVAQGAMVDAVARGDYDFATVNQTTGSARSDELVRRYGINREQYWIVPGAGLRLFHLNTSRPLFRNNARLRQAVNFAVDRRALVRELGARGGRPTDQYLLPTTPGYRDARIYPLEGPDLRRARALARGHTRGGKVVLYTPSPAVPVAASQVVQRNLRAIGLEVEIRQFPAAVAFDRMLAPGEPFDIGYIGYFGRNDGTFLDLLFHGRTIGKLGSANRSHFDSEVYNALLDQVSSMSGEARYRAYGELDVRISRDAAPAIPWAAVNAVAFVSARVGCVVMNPTLDLTAICLKR